MIEYYKDKVRDKKIPYAIFQAQEEDTVITLYESGKAMFLFFLLNIRKKLEIFMGGGGYNIIGE